jgi:DHA1 family multidrug resistance protein-like MFS transporter
MLCAGSISAVCRWWSNSVEDLIPTYPRQVPLISLLRRARGTEAKQPLPRDVIVLGVVAFFVMVGFGVVVPVLPVYVRSFGVGYLEVGAVVSAFAVMRLVANPFVGKLVDWAGERTILAVGIGIVAVSSALVAFADSYIQVLVLRGVGGIGSAMFTVSAMTLLLASTSSSSRGRAVGFYQGGFLIGGMAGPAVGGLLATISLSAPFLFYAGTLAIAGLVGLLMLQNRKHVVVDVAVPVIPIRSVLGDRRFQAACIANLAQGWAAMGVRTALIPVLVVESLGREPAWTGIAFAVAAVAQALALGPAGRFVDTVGRRPAIIGSFTAGAVIMVFIPFVTSIAVLIVLLSLYGVAAAFMGTAPAASVGDAAGARGGMPVAVFQAFADVGAIAGPLVAGLLVDSFSFPVAFVSAGALMVAAALFALRMPRETSRAAASA